MERLEQQKENFDLKKEVLEHEMEFKQELLKDRGEVAAAVDVGIAGGGRGVGSVHVGDEVRPRPRKKNEIYSIYAFPWFCAACHKHGTDCD